MASKKTQDQDQQPASATSGEYRVLARKYRPQDFSGLQGQEALVRTLTNAIDSGRIAHAFMLTGVRGVGKTTTARIIARGLNCEKGPTVTPCGQCEQCRSIAEDRNMDVLEIDAASKTGVDDVREIIDSVQYAPVSARYKVFIIDEVHMLSKAAFNALLKTLEEPPPHVKFIFATTEIRKVPVTVLSRCQRFDLKRIGADVLQKYFTDVILKNEKVEAEPEAVALIARAADGSARDGLSLLDQAISREPAKVTEAQVRAMLGLVDRSVTFDLFDTVIRGDCPLALSHLDGLYKGGADPLVVLQDLLDLTHYLTKVKVSPDVARDQALPEAERVRGAALARDLSIPVLTRAWQVLLKGAAEVQQAFNPQNALEMVVIRLMHVSDQPTPGDLMKQIKEGMSSGTLPAGAGSGNGAPRGTTVMRAVAGGGSSAAGAAAVAREVSVDPSPATQAAAALRTFEDVVALFGEKREALLQADLARYVHIAKFETGHISLRLADGAPANIPGQLSERLRQWTGMPWVISLSREQGEETLSTRRLAAESAVMDEVKAHPVVASVLMAFPDAVLREIRTKK